MNKNIIIGIVVVVVVAGGIYWYMQNQNSAGNMPSYGVPAPTSQTPTAPVANPSPVPTQAPTPSPAPKSAPAPVPAPVTHNVTIQNFAFSPASITVKKGDTVIWTNNDSMGHTVTGNNGGPASPTVSGNGGTYSYTFSAVGTFAYHCAIHPSMMGTVTVTQ